MLSVFKRKKKRIYLIYLKGKTCVFRESKLEANYVSKLFSDKSDKSVSLNILSRIRDLEKTCGGINEKQRICYLRSIRKSVIDRSASDNSLFRINSKEKISNSLILDMLKKKRICPIYLKN